MLLTLFAFVVALGLLIAVHEWGHYRMAVARGGHASRTPARALTMSA